MLDRTFFMERRSESLIGAFPSAADSSAAVRARYEAWPDQLGALIAAPVRRFRIWRRQRVVRDLKAYLDDLTMNDAEIEFHFYGDNLAFARSANDQSRSVDTAERSAKT